MRTIVIKGDPIDRKLGTVPVLRADVPNPAVGYGVAQFRAWRISLALTPQERDRIAAAAVAVGEWPQQSALN